VSPAKEILVCATDVMEQEFCRSSYHLRNSLKIASGPEVSDEVRSMVDGGIGVAWTTATVEEATTVAAEEARGERKNMKFKRAPIKMLRIDPEHSQDDDHNDVNRHQKSRRTRLHARRQRW